MYAMQDAELYVLEYCIVHIGSCPTLHSTDRCPAASYTAINSTHSTDRQLHDPRQVSLMDRCPLAQIGPIYSGLGSSGVKVHLCSN